MRDQNGHRVGDKVPDFLYVMSSPIGCMHLNSRTYTTPGSTLLVDRVQRSLVLTWSSFPGVEWGLGERGQMISMDARPIPVTASKFDQ